jgi:hypothetical protein
VVLTVFSISQEIRGVMSGWAFVWVKRMVIKRRARAVTVGKMDDLGWNASLMLSFPVTAVTRGLRYAAIMGMLCE